MHAIAALEIYLRVSKTDLPLQEKLQLHNICKSGERTHDQSRAAHTPVPGNSELYNNLEPYSSRMLACCKQQFSSSGSGLASPHPLFGSLNQCRVLSAHPQMPQAPLRLPEMRVGNMVQSLASSPSIPSLAPLPAPRLSNAGISYCPDRPS